MFSLFSFLSVGNLGTPHSLAEPFFQILHQGTWKFRPCFRKTFFVARWPENAEEAKDRLKKNLLHFQARAERSD